MGDRLIQWALDIQSGRVDLRDQEVAVALCGDLTDAAMAHMQRLRVELDDRRNAALAALLGDEVIEGVAELVATYYPDDPDAQEPTAFDIACQVVRYLAGTIAPLVLPPVEPLTAEEHTNGSHPTGEERDR